MPEIPEPAETCPRCRYFSQTEVKRAALRRGFKQPWPKGIDQTKALEILVKAFPDSYGRRGR